MKNKENLKALFESISKRRSGKWSKTFLNMKTGEVIKVLKTEWNLKSTPSIYAGNFSRRGIFQVTTCTLPDKTGWLVKRIK